MSSQSSKEEFMSQLHTNSDDTSSNNEIQLEETYDDNNLSNQFINTKTKIVLRNIIHGKDNVNVHLDAKSRDEVTGITCVTGVSNNTCNGGETPKKQRKNKKSKCFLCQKKLSLVALTIGKCKCNNIFCNTHRIPETHDCKFNHQKTWKIELEKKNPLVVTPKLENKI